MGSRAPGEGAAPRGRFIDERVPGDGTVVATGAPSITVEARAGETLTGSTDGIADADGLSGTTFAQWVSSADGADADIGGATGASYVLDDADMGRGSRFGRASPTTPATARS